MPSAVSSIVPHSDSTDSRATSVGRERRRRSATTHDALTTTRDRPATSPATAGAAARYKTELCRSYEETGGSCRYGDKCQFAHGIAELRTVDRHPRYKTQLCRTFHTRGFCAYGARCHFIHNVDEIPPSAADSLDRVSAYLF